MANLYGIQPEEITVYWPYILPLLNKPFTRMEILKKYYDIDHVLEEIKAKRMQCWIAHADDKIDAVFVTKISPHPKGSVFEIPLVGAEKGTINAWIDAIDVFKAFAKEHGCSMVKGCGRLGWVKVLKPDIVQTEFYIEV